MGNRLKTVLALSLVCAVFALVALPQQDALAMPTKTTTCLTGSCHGPVSTQASLAWGAIAGGTSYPANPTALTVQAGSSFELEWIATGITDASHGNLGMVPMIALPTVAPTAWTIGTGTAASSGITGWNAVWNSTNSWNWRTGTVLGVSATWPGTPNGYTVDYSGSTLWGTSGGAAYDNAAATTPGDKDGVADKMGTDVVINVPADTPAGTYSVTIAAVGHYYTTKSAKAHKSQAVTITVTAAGGGDTTKPVVSAGFAATTPSLSRTIAVSGFAATDNTGVTGYLITTSATAPLSGDAGWLGTAPTSYAVASDGSFTLYPWAKDAAGNVSLVYGAPVTVTVDTLLPTVSSTVPVNGASSTNLNGPVTLNFSESIDCTTVSTSSVTISPTVTWTRTSCTGSQAIFTPAGQANSTSYTVTVGTAVKDAAGNAMAASYPFSYTTAAPAPNNPPGAPASLAQYKSDGTTLLTKGLYTNQTTLVFKGTVTDPESDTVQLDIEIADVGASFTGTPTCSSTLVASGATAAATCSGIAGGRFKWQARGTDSKSSTGNWTQY